MISRFLRAGALLLALAAPALAQVPPAPTPTPVAPTPTPVPHPNPAPTPVPGVPKPPAGDDTPAPKVTDDNTKPAAPPAAKPTPAPTAEKPKTIAELTKGYDKDEGLFTLYRKVEKNRQKILAEIKPSQIGPLYLLQSTFETGAAGKVAAGRPARDLVWRWEKTPDDRLLVSAPNLWYRSTDPNLKQAVDRDFPDAYLADFPILFTEDSSGDYLIDFTSFFDGSLTGLDTAFAVDGPARATQDSYRLDPALTFFRSIKNFPLNMVVDANYTYGRVGNGVGDDADSLADPRSLPLQVVFNLYGLPQNTDYQPRPADPRVGFFINGQLSSGRTGFESFDDEAATDPRVTYINRWNLKKANPAAPMSIPLQPIVFYIDSTVPQKYRKVMREGILAWNKPFEELGYIGAIEVRDSEGVVGYDHADMRFNTLRWNASPPSNGGAYAVALLRENPLTGQIINASITVDANFARVAYREVQDVVNPISAQDGNEVREPISQFADPRFNDQKYVDDLLRAIVAHEFGHVLGLRHNFLASTFHSPAALANPEIVRKTGVSASVMDYVGFNVFGLKTGAPLFATGPGVYDYWAIKYGYTPIIVRTPDAQKPALKQIAAQSSLPGHAYNEDSLADGYDPTIVRYDLSSDPLTYAETSFGVTRELLATLLQRKPKPSESYAEFTRRLLGLIRSKGRDASIAARFVGGYRVRRVVRGGTNPDEPFSPVPISEQRRALKILASEIFAPDAFNIPANYLTKTAPDPYDFGDANAGAAFPIRDQISDLRGAILSGMLSTARLTRLANGAWKFPTETIPFTEYFPTLRHAVWGTITPKTAYTALQRDLAEQHLDILIDLATGKRGDVPGDARRVAASELRALKTQLGAPRKSSPDALSRLLFADSLRKIDLALTKKMD